MSVTSAPDATDSPRRLILKSALGAGRTPTLDRARMVLGFLLCSFAGSARELEVTS